MPATGSRSADAFAEQLCVVTGGLGFIGSNLVHRLARAGAKVRVIDALVPEHGGDLRNVEGLDIDVEICLVGDPTSASAFTGAAAVFNLAGQVSHTASMVDPESDLLYNAVSHARLLEMLRQLRTPPKVVHTSTRQVYGRPLRTPVDETHPTRPVDVNGASKLAGEQLHMVYANAYDMPIASLRLTNVYGPRQRLSSGELGFLPVFVKRALEGGTIELFGDGGQRRDCLFVDDVIDAILAATNPAAAGHVFNVGHDVDHSLAEIARVMIEATGQGDIHCREWPGENQRIDIGSFHTDSSAIADAVGWRATTGLEAGLRQTVSFYRSEPWYLS